MNCADITALLPEYIRRRLPAAQGATVRAHLAACPACAAAYEEELAFGSLAQATDSPTPPFLMARVMADVRAEPRQMPAFRVCPLDFAVAFALALALGGLTVAALSLWSISPLITDALAPDAWFTGVTAQTLALASLWAAIVIGCSIPIAVATRAAHIRSRQSSLPHHLPFS